jgi:hypothetical protein
LCSLHELGMVLHLQLGDGVIFASQFIMHFNLYSQEYAALWSFSESVTAMEMTGRDLETAGKTI